jgi:hypothetical protein
LSSEIGRLTGGVVKAYGPHTAGAPWPVISAVRYRLVSVNGRAPLVGTIRLEGGHVWLDLEESGGTVELMHSPPAISRPGLKVYVIGPRTSGVDVEQFGVLR